MILSSKRFDVIIICEDLVHLVDQMKLAIFDLDYTIWRPEMYQLHGPPKLAPISKARYNLSHRSLAEARTIKKDMILVDRSGDPMRVFEGA